MPSSLAAPMLLATRTVCTLSEERGKDDDGFGWKKVLAGEGEILRTTHRL